MDYIKILIRNTKNYMAENKLSNQDLAKKSGIHYTYLLSLLNEKQNFTLLNVERISKATGMTWAQLFTPDYKQLKGADARELIAEGNKEAVIQQQRNQIENLKKEVERMRDEIEARESINPVEIVEAPTPVVDKTLRLSICNGVSEMHLNGATVPLENIEDTDLLKKQVMVTMVFDEILIK